MGKEQIKRSLEPNRTGIHKREWKNMLAGYAFISPVIIGLLVFTAIPFFYSLFLAFTDFDGLNTPQWTGVRNFVTMFTDDDKFWISLKVTFRFAIIQIPLKLGFALLVAVLLSKAVGGIGAYRIAFYIPSVLGGSVAIAMTWKTLWGKEGAINSILGVFGLEPVNWLKNPSTALYVLILLGVWQFGSSMLIFLAGIKEIPQTYYEAAIMDGAGVWKRFTKITLPMLSSCIFFNRFASGL